MNQQSRHRHLPLVVLGQRETAQLGAEMPCHPRRQRGRDRPPVRRQPAFAPVTCDMRVEHQVLHHKILIAFEPRADGHCRLDHPILVDDAARGLLAAAAVLALPGRGLRLRRVFHAARFERRPAR